MLLSRHSYIHDRALVVRDLVDSVVTCATVPTLPLSRNYSGIRTHSHVFLSATTPHGYLSLLLLCLRHKQQLIEVHITGSLRIDTERCRADTDFDSLATIIPLLIVRVYLLTTFFHATVSSLRPSQSSLNRLAVSSNPQLLRSFIN